MIFASDLDALQQASAAVIAAEDAFSDLSRRPRGPELNAWAEHRAFCNAGIVLDAAYALEERVLNGIRDKMREKARKAAGSEVVKTSPPTAPQAPTEVRS